MYVAVHAYVYVCDWNIFRDNDLFIPTIFMVDISIGEHVFYTFIAVIIVIFIFVRYLMFVDLNLCHSDVQSKTDDVEKSTTVIDLYCMWFVFSIMTISL